MNKLLTTITLLCFSVASNADVYVCDSTAIGNVVRYYEWLVPKAGLEQLYKSITYGTKDNLHTVVHTFLLFQMYLFVQFTPLKL